MRSPFTPPSSSYSIEGTCASLAGRLRVMRETAMAAIKYVGQNHRRKQEAGNG